MASQQHKLSVRNKSAESPPLPGRIFAQASPRSIGGESLFAVDEPMTPRSVARFYSTRDMVVRAAAKLHEAGLDVLQVTPLTINFAGDQQTIERAFRTDIVAEERPTCKPREGLTTATFIDCPHTVMPGLIETTGTGFYDTIEGIALEERRYEMWPSAYPPKPGYWHLDVPDDVSSGCNAIPLHCLGITGQGVRVAMVDTGFYHHPFYLTRGYRVGPVVLGPGAIDTSRDEVGHGTGEAANIFAVAPGAELLPVKANFTNVVGAFNAAVGLLPDILTCSWGSHKPFALSAADRALGASVATAAGLGIVVIFSAGNGQAGFPGQHPDVISAGGVYVDEVGNPMGSDYASAFDSLIYPGRHVPDVCGLVGMRPKAIYIMLPVEPGDRLDVENGNTPFPMADETAPDDGWAAFSGTSAAAPQLAGCAALLKQISPTLTTSGVKSCLMLSARNITTGISNVVPDLNLGLPAGPGGGTGSGLVDATAAAYPAYLHAQGASGTLLASMPALPAAGPTPRPPGPAAAAKSGARGREESLRLVTAQVILKDRSRPAVAAVRAALGNAGFALGPVVGGSFSITAPASTFERVIGKAPRAAPGVESREAGAEPEGAEEEPAELPLDALPQPLRSKIDSITQTRGYGPFRP